MTIIDDLIPDYWRAVERFVTEEIPSIPWFQQIGPVNPAWRHVTGPTWEAAWDAAVEAAGESSRAAGWDAAVEAAWTATESAARKAARKADGKAAREAAEKAAGEAVWAASWEAAGEAAGDAAWDAALYTIVEHVCGDLDLAEEHRQHVRDRWAVWQAGYALLCDVDGILVTYGVAP